MPFFLAYHRWLGVQHFIVIDNRSQDGTLDLLQRERDVTCISAPGEYGASFGGAWIEWAFRLAPPERWNLLLDADELFVGPALRPGALRTLIRELDNEGVAIAATTMVDCYPAKFPFAKQHFEPVPWNRASYFDAGPYIQWSASRLRIDRRYNGVRERLCWPYWRWLRRITGFLPRPLRARLLQDSPPGVVKMPLLRNVPGLSFNSVHSSSGVPRSRDLYGLLHYKLDIDLAAKVDLALRERQHWQGSREYEAYGRIFSKPDGFDLRFKGTRRFEGVRSLVDAKLVSFAESSQHGAGLDDPPLGDVEREVWGFGDYALQKQVWEHAWGPTPEQNTGAKSPDRSLSTA